MRVLPLTLTVLLGLARSALASPGDDVQAFMTASGLDWLCQTTESLALEGGAVATDSRLGAALHANRLCGELANRMERAAPPAQFAEALQQLHDPIVRQLSEAERQLDPQAFGDYRRKLQASPPGARRQQQVAALDDAMRTSEMTLAMRREALKLMASAQQPALDEAALEQRVRPRDAQLATETRAAVRDFMFYSYRHVAGDQLQQATLRYEAPAARALLDLALRAYGESCAALRQPARG